MSVFLREKREISPAAADVLGTQPTVRIQTLERGDLFGCKQTLLERVRQKGGLRVEEDVSGSARSCWATTEEKANVTVVFSSISYCLPDYMIEIEMAMNNVAEYLPGGAPVILVLMHFTDDADCPDIIRSLDGDPRLPSWHIEDFVNVLYWPSGLLTCPLNKRAVAQLHSALLKHSTAQPTVRIQALERGDLFGCKQTLLERVRQKGGLRVEERMFRPSARSCWATTEEKANVTVVFSPISYCLPDYMIEIETAMNNVAEYLPGGAPVILVLMHLTDDDDCPDIIRSLDGDPRLPSWHIEDFVNVLYWPSGLLTCPLNERAVAQLHSALLKHSSVVSPAAASGSSSGKARGGQGRR